MFIESEHIKELVKQGTVNIVKGEIVKEFSDYLKELKWSDSGTRLNFNLLEHKIINISKVSQEKLICEIEGTSLCKDEKLIFFHSEEQAGLICERNFGMENIDYIFWKAPGIRFVFGGDLIDGEIHPHYDHFAMYDGSDSLFVKI